MRQLGTVELPLALAALVATVISAPPTPMTLAAPTFQRSERETGSSALCFDHFSQLSMRGLRVISASDIAALLGLERQKQLMGCAEGAPLDYRTRSGGRRHRRIISGRRLRIIAW